MVLRSGLVLSLIVVGTIGRLLESEKIYAIQNALYGTYLEAVGNGKTCERLSDVKTSAILNPDSEAFRWKYSTYFKNYVNLLLNSHKLELEMNEVTMEGLPPFCFNSHAQYEQTLFTEETSIIKSLYTEKCLKANGVGQLISWDQCQTGEKSQMWNFINLTIPGENFRLA